MDLYSPARFSLMLPQIETPVIRLAGLFPDGQVYAKCEFLQVSGCFKIHGAVHLLEHLRNQGRIASIVVPSMGNTAIGAGVAAQAFGFAMAGVVPETISLAKDQKLERLGVELVKVAGGSEELLRTARTIAEERAAYFVHPHLDPLWTDGYQAIAEQIMRCLPECRSLVIPVGGGGLLMGMTEYLARHRHAVRLVGCEAYNFPTYARYDHLRTSTIADGLVLGQPHAAVARRIAEQVIPIHLVGDPEIRQAMRELFEEQALIVEPSSAITVALAKSRLGELEPPVCLVLTGGNIADEDFWRLIF